MQLTGLKIVDGETKDFFEPSPNDEDARREERQGRPPQPPPDKPIDGKMAKGEIARALCLLYNMVHRLIRDDVRYKANDFSEEADGIYDLVAQHGQLRVVLRLASPIAAVGAVWEKVDATVSRLKARQAAQRAAKNQSTEAPSSDEQVKSATGKRAPFKV